MKLAELTLTDFLLARVAEDGDPRRLLAIRLQTAEAETVAAWADYSDWIDGKGVDRATPPRTVPRGELEGLRVAARLLALSFADHPEYNEAWRL